MNKTATINNDIIDNIKIGDLLYGLEEKREQIRQQLNQKYGIYCWTIDNINNTNNCKFIILSNGDK